MTATTTPARPSTAAELSELVGTELGPTPGTRSVRIG